MSDKQLKEDFIKGLTGSSLTDISLILYSIVVSYGLWHLSTKLLINHRQLVAITQAKADNNPNWSWFWVDLLALCFPLLAFSTSFHEQVAAFNLIGSFIIIVYIVISSSSNSNKKGKKSNKPNASVINQKKQKLIHFLSTFRSFLMILTCIAILAVDFKIFPRKFAKVEEFGSSLMDIGVGAFVFSSGLVSGRSLNRNSKDGTGQIIKNLTKALYHSIPLLVLGVIRLISVKGLEYQEHVTEYGVHWNFFFTLGCLPIPAAIADMISEDPELIGWVLITLYQTVLSQTTLQTYIFSDTRIMGHLFSMNREGICSLFGYISIFLIGKKIGQLVFRSDSTKLGQKLLIKCLIINVVFFISRCGLSIEISRRLANLSYVSWVCSMMPLLLYGFYFMEKALDIQEAPILLQAVNYNGLFIFLIANLMTGFVNMTINTLETSPLTANLILMTYITIVTGIAYFLFYMKFKVIRF